jgi:hypothetical protein
MTVALVLLVVEVLVPAARRLLKPWGRRTETGARPSTFGALAVPRSATDRCDWGCRSETGLAQPLQEVVAPGATRLASASVRKLIPAAHLSRHDGRTRRAF